MLSHETHHFKLSHYSPSLGSFWPASLALFQLLSTWRQLCGSFLVAYLARVTANKTCIYSSPYTRSSTLSHNVKKSLVQNEAKNIGKSQSNCVLVGPGTWVYQLQHIPPWLLELRHIKMTIQKQSPLLPSLVPFPYISRLFLGFYCYCIHCYTIYITHMPNNTNYANLSPWILIVYFVFLNVRNKLWKVLLHRFENQCILPTKKQYSYQTQKYHTASLLAVYQ